MAATSAPLARVALRSATSRQNAKKKPFKRSKRFLNQKFGEDFTSTRSQKGGVACLVKYGSDYFRHIVSLRRDRQQKTAAK